MPAPDNEASAHHCEHCDEHDMVPGALAQRLKDERNLARAEVERLRDALSELVNAGEPFVGDAFPAEQLDGRWLRIFNRWQAAMNDGQAALRDAPSSPDARGRSRTP